ncbi:MAG: hypothetical protein IJP83_01760 [Mycoplasma sp.]|nr:hypothetical protein [Mycoplasma sp.]
MSKFNKHTKKYNITEQNLIGFDEIIASIPKNIKKSMVLYITTWQEKPDDPQQTNTMTTKPEWFKEFEEKQEKRWEEQRKFNEKQEKRWKEQEKFNERILALIESLVQRIENIEKRLDVIEKRVENIEHRLDKLESRIDNLVIKNNLRE